MKKHDLESIRRRRLLQDGRHHAKVSSGDPYVARGRRGANCRRKMPVHGAININCRNICI